MGPPIASLDELRQSMDQNKAKGAGDNVGSSSRPTSYAVCLSNSYHPS